MKETTKQIHHCPKCNREYVASPVISREDNKTEICPNCGLFESLGAFSKHVEEKNARATAEKLCSRLSRSSLL